ncbi:MAG: ABC transporter permease subunit [Anaerolineae bacterium]|nr:ABC transporter permease subunit [Anaerolineae bacterium]
MPDVRGAAYSADQAARLRRQKLRRKRIQLVLKAILAVVILLFTLYPILWTISAAFNPRGGLSADQFIPAAPSLRNFESILEEPFLRWMGNSILLASVASVLSVAVTTLAAYSFSRFRFRFRRQLLLGILVIQVFPILLTMVALYALMRQIGAYIPWLGLNSHGGLILLYLGGAMGINVWLMKGFFDSIPRDIDESAMVDGATHWQIFWRLILPLARPILVVVGILTFVGVYSDWALARIVLQDNDKYTLMLGLQSFIQYDYGSNWGAFSAGAVLGAIPIVVIYIALQDHIVGGLTSGAVKG